MKNIIQRNLPLNTVYSLIDTKYISLIDGYGCTCDNCGKLIANIATVSNGVERYNIGFDCLDTILQNNAILSEIDVLQYDAYKQAILKCKRFVKSVADTCKSNSHITGLKFEKPTYETDFHTFYWLTNGASHSRNNDNVKIKGVSFELVVKVTSDFFKHLTVITN